MRGVQWRRLVLILTLVGLVPIRLTGPALPSGPTALAETPSVGCNDGADGLILYEQIQSSEEDAGTPAAMTGARLNVSTTDGAEVHRIHLSVTGSPFLFPLGAGCLTIAGNYNSGDPPLLIDPWACTVRPIVLSDGTASPDLIPFSGSLRTHQPRRYAVLGRNDDPWGMMLLDTQTAIVTDVLAVIRELGGDINFRCVPCGVQLSADEKFLLVQNRLSIDSGLWLLPTGDLRSGRLIGSAWLATFSEDGQRILYTQQQGENDYWLIAEGIDGSGNEIVATSDDSLGGAWVPGTSGTQVLILRNHTVSLLDMTTRQERELASPDGDESLVLWRFAPSGQRALLKTGDIVNDGHQRWIWLDLGTDTVRELDPLAGAHPPSGSRWLTFILTTPTEMGAKAGDAVLGLDLETGAVRRLFVFDRDIAFIGLYSSATGRFTVINDLDEATADNFWLLDVDAGKAQNFPGRHGGDFSPDGKWVLASERTNPGESPPRNRLVMTSTEGGEERVVSDDSYSAVWVPLLPPA